MINVKSILLLCMLAMAGAIWFAISSANAKAASLAVALEQLQQELAVKETEVTELGNAIELIELQKQQLINDRNLIADIQKKREQKLIHVENEYEAAMKLIAELKANENETISNWAAVAIPFDVGGMLRYAAAPAYDQNYHGNQTDTGVTTSRIRHSLQSHQDF